MNIAYIFSYFGDGGAEEHAALLARQARASGNNVIFIISSSSKTSDKMLAKEKFNVVRLPMESSFRPAQVTKSIIGLKKVIKDNNIEIVHAHMLREQSLAIMAKLFGSKFILIRTFHRFNQYSWKMRPLMSFYRKFTDAFISISNTMSGYLKQHGFTGNVREIRNGVPKINAPNHEKALGFIGRLAAEKGILNFIRNNVEFLRKTKLVIAGDGPDEDEIKEIIADNNLNIEMLGRVTDKDSFYKKISVMILPSDTEVMPLVVLEAFSCGLPVVAFDLESLEELISEENGILVDYPDYAQMRREAIDLMSSSNKFSKANIAKYESDYLVEKMWHQTNALYEELIKNRKKC